MAKTRKGGTGKNKKSGKKRGAPPKKRAKPKKAAGRPKGAPAAGGIGGARPAPMEVDPGYYILKQFFNSVEYEVGRVLVESSTLREHWFLYNLTQPTGSMNGYTYPSSVNGQYKSTNVSTRFIYAGTSTVAAICQAVGSISTYKILNQFDGSCT